MAEDEHKIDPKDYKVLLNAILRQAIDDYIKLQHPKFRNKKYLQEAFSSAVELFFNGDFQFLYLKNEYDEELTLKGLIAHLLDDDRQDIERLKDHVVDEARKFWETKLIRTLYIPDSFIYDGHVYSVHHTETEETTIDYKNKTILIDKREDSTAEQEFLIAVLKVAFYHEEKLYTDEDIKEFGKILFRMLKINSCFTGS